MASQLTTRGRFRVKALASVFITACLCGTLFVNAHSAGAKENDGTTADNDAATAQIMETGESLAGETAVREVPASDDVNDAQPSAEAQGEGAPDESNATEAATTAVEAAARTRTVDAESDATVTPAKKETTDQPAASSEATAQEDAAEDTDGDTDVQSDESGEASDQETPAGESKETADSGAADQAKESAEPKTDESKDAEESKSEKTESKETESKEGTKTATAAVLDGTLVDCKAGDDFSGEYTEKANCRRPLNTTVDNSIFDSHVVTDVENPGGTSVNLFDYWWASENAADADYKDEDGQYPGTTAAFPYWNSGINKGHQLHFNRGGDRGRAPTGDAAIEGDNDTLYRLRNGNYNTSLHGGQGVTYQYLSGMVKNTLRDGYPVLAENRTTGQKSSTGILHDESLDYLFNLSQQDGKRSHSGVKGLFQLEDGYHTYSSQKNYAWYDQSTNSFKLYDGVGVSPGTGTNTPPGQFFPFTAPADVFKTTDGGTTPATVDGKLAMDSSVASWSPKLNHYFGLTMSSRFVQQKDGFDNNGRPVSFEFSGDDDVWVFVDGVLVGDLGGIHDASKLTIDFQTGEVRQVKLRDTSTEVAGTETVSSLYERYAAAGQTDATEWTTNEAGQQVFANDTYHTLKFFYMERGNGSSNMSLRFNLVTAPESNVIKVDQEGMAVPGAGFTMYASDDTYATAGEVIATGATDLSGNLNLVDPVSGEPVLIDDLADRHGEHFILRETTVPAGYRKAGDMHLKYEKNRDTAPGSASDSGVLVTDPGTSSADGNAWDTGSLALAQVQVSAPDESELSYADKNGVTQSLDADRVRNGTLFAVVFQKGSDGKWRGIYGDQIGGWKTTAAENQGGDADMKAVMETFRNSPHKFQLSSGGSYDVLLEDLPGDIRDYYYWNGDMDSAKYSVGYYWSSAGEDAQVSADNTFLLDNTTESGADRTAAPFKRMFGVMLYVTNIRNTVSVQKVDQDGNPLNGAGFALYRAEAANGAAVCGAADAAMVQATCQLIDTLTSADYRSGGRNGAGVSEPKLNGSGTFPHTAGVSLVNGTYYMVETSAPSDAYELNTHPTEVVVNDSGVFVNAGTADDGITVARGVGNLVKTMNTYGAHGDVDSTLTWLKSTPGLFATVPDWGNGSAAEQTARGKAEAARVLDGRLVPTGTYDGTNPLRLGYGTEGTVLEYGPRDTNNLALMFTSETGWLALSTKQDAATNGYQSAGRVDLGGKRLSALITGSALVQVTDTTKPTATTAAVRKTVKDLTSDKQEDSLWPAAAKFLFRLTPQEITLDKDASVTGEPTTLTGPLPSGGAGTADAPADACAKPASADSGTTPDASDATGAASCTVTVTKPATGLTAAATLGDFAFGWDDVKAAKPRIVDGVAGVRTVTYRYQVQEIGADGTAEGAGGIGEDDGLTYSKALYDLGITLTYTPGTGLKATASLIKMKHDDGKPVANGSSAVTPDADGEFKGVPVAGFTNEKRPVTALLPETGGTAALVWTIAGGLLAIAAGLAYAVTRWYHGRRALGL